MGRPFETCRGTDRPLPKGPANPYCHHHPRSPRKAQCPHRGGAAPLRPPSEARLHRRRGQGAGDPWRGRSLGVRRRSGRAGGNVRRERGVFTSRRVRPQRGRRSALPAPRQLPLPGHPDSLLRELRRRPAQPPGIQKDQHRRGQGLLLRVAFLSSRRRRPGDRLGGRSLWPCCLALRRLGGADVAVGAHHGFAQIPGDGVHRAAIHRPGNGRMPVCQRRCAPRPTRGRSGEVRSRLRHHPQCRHGSGAEDLFRGIQTAPGRVPGQHSRCLARIHAPPHETGRRPRTGCRQPFGGVSPLRSRHSTSAIPRSGV
ncbi:MAG: hypothetical protein KatS3mg124_0649 [Porticoccaceae bacterium]|nr:MAG: hypothetical protein KatS3mg124_0649 [Porticoccaceae bacterium]